MEGRVPYDDFPVVFLPPYESPPAWVPPHEVSPARGERGDGPGVAAAAAGPRRAGEPGPAPAEPPRVPRSAFITPTTTTSSRSSCPAPSSSRSRPGRR